MDTPDKSAKVIIPTIDISGYLAGDASETTKIVTDMATACRDPGFLQITGHSVPQELCQRMLDSLEQFFALPADVKQALHRSKSTAIRGYENVGEQRLEDGTSRDQKEGFMIGPERSTNGRFLQGPNQWPEESMIPGFRETFIEYFMAVRQLSVSLFRILALGLKLDETYFDEFVTGDNGKNHPLYSHYNQRSPSLISPSNFHVSSS